MGRWLPDDAGSSIRLELPFPDRFQWIPLCVTGFQPAPRGLGAQLPHLLLVNRSIPLAPVAPMV
jgi:hypothetical protein